MPGRPEGQWWPLSFSLLGLLKITCAFTPNKFKPVVLYCQSCSESTTTHKYDEVFRNKV